VEKHPNTEGKDFKSGSSMIMWIISVNAVNATCMIKKRFVPTENPDDIDVLE